MFGLTTRGLFYNKCALLSDAVGIMELVDMGFGEETRRYNISMRRGAGRFDNFEFQIFFSAERSRQPSGGRSWKVAHGGLNESVGI